MKTSSAKSKGRRLAQWVRDKLLVYSKGLEPDDIRTTPAGVTGPDIMLSPAARTQFPFAIECKNQESLNVWSAFRQAENHAIHMFDQARVSPIPILFFSKNRTDVFVCIKATDFLNIHSGKHLEEYPKAASPDIKWKESIDTSMVSTNETPRSDG